MDVRKLFRKKGLPEPRWVEFAFCEPSWATTLSRIHIRRVERGELKLGGGIDVPALCGFDLAHGWDLAGEVTVYNIQGRMSAECGKPCLICARIFTNGGEA